VLALLNAHGKPGRVLALLMADGVWPGLAPMPGGRGRPGTRVTVRLHLVPVLAGTGRGVR
jgi:hypothetical protein